VTRIVYALVLLMGTIVACIMLAPGLADELGKVLSHFLFMAIVICSNALITTGYDQQQNGIEYVILFLCCSYRCVLIARCYLTLLKIAEDKVLVFVILREKFENRAIVSLTLILTLISRAD